VWERSIGSICKRRGLADRFDSVETNKPNHRQLCLDLCGWGRTTDSDKMEFSQIPAAERNTTYHTMTTAHALIRGDTREAVQILKSASAEYPELLFVSLALQLIGRGDIDLAKEQLDFDEAVASKTDPYLRAISSFIATGDWATIANQRTLPLRERAYVALRNFDDNRLTQWLRDEVDLAMRTGDIEGIVLTGITDGMVDILAKYVERCHDVQTATLIMSFCAPRYVDDHRCAAWRKAYRAYLQRHRAFLQRTKFEVESTKKSKRGPDARPGIATPFRQIALRCVYCDAETRLGGPGPGQPPASSSAEVALPGKLANAGVSCPNCKRHLPRCVVCLEVVGMPRSDKPELSADPETRLAAKFPTFCLQCEHVLHLDHARQWFARHAECPVPECRCRCNFRANPELNYH
jgi:WD repeat-containing protein mio